MGLADTARGVALGAASLAVRQARAVSTSLLTATDGRDVILNDPDGWEVDQPWLWWMGPAGGGGSGGPFGNPIPGAGSPALQATTIPGVGRATSLIVDTMAALPWRVLRGTELSTRSWLDDPQNLTLDGRVVDPARPAPTARWSRVDFWSQWIISALWWGDGYVWVPSRDSAGEPKPPLYVLSPKLVTIEDRRYFVDVGDEDPMELGPTEIIHLRGLGPIHGEHGTGALTRYAGALGAVRDVRDYASGVFHSGVPAGYLKSAQPKLNQDQADTLKASWMAAHGSTSRNIAVLNATTEFHPLTFKPVDAELIEMLKWSLLDIANTFGVPPYMLGAPTDSGTYANIESRMIEFVRFTLMPWSARIEAVLDAELAHGTTLKIALDALLRADTKTRYEAYKMAKDAGWLTVNEIRALEDLPPLDEEPPADPTSFVEPQPVPEVTNA